MSLSIARQVRDLKRNPVQWYHGAPESDVLQNKLSTTCRALKVIKELDEARIGVVGGLEIGNESGSVDESACLGTVLSLLAGLSEDTTSIPTRYLGALAP